MKKREQLAVKIVFFEYLHFYWNDKHYQWYFVLELI